MVKEYKPFDYYDGKEKVEVPTVDNSTNTVEDSTGTTKTNNTSTKNTGVKTASSSGTTATANSGFVPSADVLQAQNLLQQWQTNRPGNYTPAWQDEADAYLSQYTNRGPFSYDFNADALYQQYKDNYIQQGQMAMMDTMGQAAAMTGGYGNSYAQNVGQQAYNQYLGQLNAVMPELYQMAHDRYTQEGQEMLNMYDLYMNREAQEYGRYQDDLSNWYQEMSRLQSDYDSQYAKEYTKYRDDVADQQWEKTYSKSLYSYTGVGDDEDDDDDDNSGDNYDNGGVSEANIKAMQAALGVDADGMWGEKSQKAAGGLSADEAYKQFTMGKLSGAQRVSDGMIKKFQSTIQPESMHDAVARSMYGPYTAYVAYMLEKDTSLTDAEKDYLISLYGITSSDRKYLLDKGLIK